MTPIFHLFKDYTSGLHVFSRSTDLFSTSRANPFVECTFSPSSIPLALCCVKLYQDALWTRLTCVIFVSVLLGCSAFSNDIHSNHITPDNWLALTVLQSPIEAMATSILHIKALALSLKSSHQDFLPFMMSTITMFWTSCNLFAKRKITQKHSNLAWLTFSSNTCKSQSAQHSPNI